MTQKEKNIIIARCRKAKACEPEFKKLLAAKTDEELLAVLARNIAWCCNRDILSASTLKVLSRDKHSDVRCHVALNPKTSAATLKVLSRDKHPDVRYHVARNPKTPASTLKALSKDEDSYVRNAAHR